MPMPNRHIQDANGYRYAYQGQEKDPETGKEAFELRLWDGRIGRWLTTDPAGQYHSPYLGMGNNPISRVDPDGGMDGGPGDPPWWTKLFNYFTGLGKANDQISNSVDVTNFTDEEIESRNSSRLTEGISELNQDINDHVSISAEVKARVTFGPGGAGGIDGLSVDGRVVSREIVSINPKVEFRLLDGFSGRLNIKAENKIINRIGVGFIVGGALERTFTHATENPQSRIIDTQTIQQTNYLFLKQKMVTNMNGDQKFSLGVSQGLKGGVFFVGEISGGVFINFNN